MDEFDVESGMGNPEPGLPPKTYVMAAGMHTGVRPIIPPKVWDSGENFHPAAKELAAIHEVKGIEFDKKILSPAAFEKFEEARAAVKATPVCTNPPTRRANGDDVKVIPLGTSSALPSKYRNGTSPFFSSHKV